MKVKTKGSFVTKAHRFISKGPGETMQMPREDYEEVVDLCEVLEEDRKPKSKAIKYKKDKCLDNNSLNVLNLTNNRKKKITEV